MILNYYMIPYPGMRLGMFVSMFCPPPPPSVANTEVSASVSAQRVDQIYELK